MQEDLSTLNLGDRFVKVLGLLDGLSTKENIVSTGEY
jgi:hypothetical protein